MNTDGTVDTILVNTPDDTVTRDVSSDVASAGNPKSIRINGSGTAPPSGKKYFIANGNVLVTNPETAIPDVNHGGGTNETTHDFGTSRLRNVSGNMYVGGTNPSSTFTFSVSDDNVNFVPYGSTYAITNNNEGTTAVFPIAKFQYFKITTVVSVNDGANFTGFSSVDAFKVQLYNAANIDSDTGGTRVELDVGYAQHANPFELYDVPSGQYLSVRLADTDSSDQTAQITELTVVETEA